MHFDYRTEQIFKDRLKVIFDNPDFAHLPQQFAFPTNLITNAILFIGINPSQSSDKIHERLESYEVFSSGNAHPYFKRFEDVSSYCSYPWTHIDLLHFRQTDQNKIHEILKSKSGVQYVWEQLQLADSLIKKINPKVIVVSNALAGRFLGIEKTATENIWLDYEFIFDNEIGTYLWKGTPVFLAGC